MNTEETVAQSDEDNGLAAKQIEAVEKHLESLKKTVDIYSQPRAEGEVDLVKVIRDKLQENGVTTERLEKAYDHSRFIEDAIPRQSHAQQFHLNRYFNDQLMMADADTRLERYQLIYEVTPFEWLKIMEKSVIPRFVELDLPKVG